MAYIYCIGSRHYYFDRWLSRYGTNYAIERMVTVMVISCPHALGLNSFGAISTAVSAQHGLLIRNKNVFAENYHNCFDKQEH